MAALLASVLPLAVGAAISPTLLALQWLVLRGTNPLPGPGPWPSAPSWVFAAYLIVRGFGELP